MLELRTVYPFGLNDRIGDEWMTENTHSSVFTRFPTLPRRFERVNRGTNHKGNNNNTVAGFLENLDHILKESLSNASNYIRITLSSMKRSSLRDIHTILSNNITDNNSSNLYDQYYLQALDIIESKLYNPKITDKPKKSPENICSIYFHNKGVEMINLANILRTAEIKSSLPFPEFDFPLITYSLSNPISHKIFNFHDFVSDLDIDKYLEDPDTIPCKCEHSKFADQHHKHIATGDLGIVKNNKLRKLLSRGPKFRETQNIDFSKAKDSIINGLKDCIENWCNRKGINKVCFKEWLSLINDKIDDKIDKLKSTYTYKHTCLSLSSPDIKTALDSLHKDFVITPIDKANGNVAVICKRFYADILFKELGLGVNYVNPTYERILEKNVDEIVNKNITDLDKSFSIKNVDTKHHCLPRIYWIPKKHKKPLKARFIIASTKCSLKALSKSITSVFSLFYKQIENYDKKCFYFSGVKGFWVVQDNKPVIEALEKISKRGKARSINTFDFSTLYTNIPHDKLLYVLNNIIDFCFNGGEHQFLKVSSFCTQWVKEKPTSGVYFDRDSLKNAVKYLITNSYFTVGSKIFRQIIGIPMGSDPAPFFANLFLYYYENKWISNLKKTDLITARKLSNIFRFIDDLNAINDNHIFLNNIANIYPPELELGKENHHDNEATFLDLNIKIVQNKFEIKLYDKRDDFNFEIVRMPFKSSNIPSKMFYNTISAESLRIARASSNSINYSNSIKPLITRMLKQGANCTKIQTSLKKSFNRHFNQFSKIAQTFESLSSLIFDQ